MICRFVQAQLGRIQVTRKDERANVDVLFSSGRRTSDPASSFHLTGSNRKPGLRLMNTRLSNRYRLSWAMKGRRALQCQKRREVLKSETKYRSSLSFRISSERTLVQYFAVTAPRYSKSIHWEMTMSSLQPFLRRRICSDSQAHSLAGLLPPQSSLANGYRCQRRQIAPISSGKG